MESSGEVTNCHHNDTRFDIIFNFKKDGIILNFKIIDIKHTKVKNLSKLRKNIENKKNYTLVLGDGSIVYTNGVVSFRSFSSDEAKIETTTFFALEPEPVLLALNNIIHQLNF